MTGEKLKETSGKDSADGKTKAQALFPLEINPLFWTAQKHSEVLWGEVPDDANAPVTFDYKKSNKRRDKLSETISDTINHVWYQSRAKEILSRGGFISQFLGGSVYRIVPDESKKYGIRINYIVPDFFLPVFDSVDPWNLLESWTVYYISKEEAQAYYGVDAGVGNMRYVLSEHWTKDYYEILINGESPKAIMGDYEKPNSGPNLIGMVPNVYIPHYVRTTSLYGWSHVPNMIQMIKELNSRVADAGDYVRENSGGDYVLKNSSQPKLVTLPNGKQGINLGMTQPGMDAPELTRMQTAALNGDMHLKLPQQIMGYIQQESAIPDIAWGVDGGSQRSAISLAFRMWPLTSHIRKEREMWAEGFKQINDISFRWMEALGTFNSTQEMRDDHLCFVNWKPMTPRDRLDLVNEVVTRLGAHAISRKHAIELLGQGEDVQEELEEIEKDMEAESKNAIKPTNNAAQASANVISRIANQ